MKSSCGLMVLIIVANALFIAGCTSPSPAGVQSPGASPFPSLTLTPHPWTGSQVRINTTGTWYGTVYLDGEVLRKIEGSGPRTYDITGNETGDKPWHRITIEVTGLSRPYPSPLSIEVLESGKVAASVATREQEAPSSHILADETLKLVYTI